VIVAKWIQMPRGGLRGRMYRSQNAIRRDSRPGLSPCWINWKRQACGSQALSLAMSPTTTGRYRFLRLGLHTDKE
jgi:hypothetical protein